MKKSTLLICALMSCSTLALATPQEPIFSVVEKEHKPYLSTLKELVSIESGSRDREGLDKISQLIFNRLKALGGQVEFMVLAIPDNY